MMARKARIAPTDVGRSDSYLSFGTASVAARVGPAKLSYHLHILVMSGDSATTVPRHGLACTFISTGQEVYRVRYGLCACLLALLASLEGSACFFGHPDSAFGVFDGRECRCALGGHLGRHDGQFSELAFGHFLHGPDGPTLGDFLRKPAEAATTPHHSLSHDFGIPTAGPMGGHHVPFGTTDRRRTADD